MDSVKPSLPAVVVVDAAIPADHPLREQLESSMSDQQKADTILAEFDKLSPDEQRLALLHLSGLSLADADHAVLVRKPNGELSMQKVSAEMKARVDQLGKQGFVSASFTNRHARRAAARRERSQRSSSSHAKSAR